MFQYRSSHKVCHVSLAGVARNLKKKIKKIQDELNAFLLMLDFCEVSLYEPGHHFAILPFFFPPPPSLCISHWFPVVLFFLLVVCCDCSWWLIIGAVIFCSVWFCSWWLMMLLLKAGGWTGNYSKVILICFLWLSRKLAPQLAVHSVMESINVLHEYHSHVLYIHTI